MAQYRIRIGQLDYLPLPNDDILPLKTVKEYHRNGTKVWEYWLADEFGEEVTKSEFAYSKAGKAKKKLDMLIDELAYSTWH